MQDLFRQLTELSNKSNVLTSEKLLLRAEKKDSGKDREGEDFTMPDFKIYHLYWEEHNWDKDINTKFDLSKHFGVYQVYGDHVVNGENTLLYIGKARDQTYSQRMKGHYDFDTSQVSKYTKLYLSYFCKVDDLSESNWKEAIDIVEKTLIKAHFPALNSQDVKGFLPKGTPNILIFNRGARGKLLPEVSTLRCSEFYHDSKKYNFAKLAIGE